MEESAQKSFRKGLRIVPAAVFLAGMAISLWVAVTLQRAYQKSDDLLFNSLVAKATDSIKDRLGLYEDGLRSGISLYAASKSVERREWREFYQSLNLIERYPGIMGVGVALIVPKKDTDAFLKTVREDEAPDFSIKPIAGGQTQKPENDIQFVLTYIEPMEQNAQALGLDLATEKERLEAALRARDTGEPAMTGTIRLIQDKSQRAAFLLFVPLYQKNRPVATVEARREAIIGWVYGAFIAEDFFRGILSSLPADVSPDIFENDSLTRESLLFDDGREPAHEEKYKKITTVTLAGRPMTMAWAHNDAYFAQNRWTSLWAGASLVLLSLIFSGLIARLQDKQRRAQEFAVEKNRVLEETRNELKQTNAELMQSQKLESLGRLASGIAHDFNNLLGVITGYVTLLGDEFKENPKAFKKLETIRKAAERGAHLTRELLGFARKGKYEKKVFDLNQIILEAQTIFTGSVDKKITLKLDLETQLWPIEGDSAQVMQILMNLVINARDAMPDGGHVLFKSENKVFKSQGESPTPLPPGLKPGSYVHLAVADTGTGIPQELLSKIFDPFFTTKDPGKGTGMGLSMVYGIMKNHDGIVTVDSSLGQGTTFHLYFPKFSSEIISETPLSSAENASKARNNTLSLVLVAEDEQWLRDLYRDYFTKYFPTTEVLIACDGEEALDIFRKRHEELDLLLLDVMMPKMDGLRAFKEMKKIKPETKIIFVSGYAESEFIANLRKTGGVGFVQKPIAPQQLLKEIETIIGVTL